MLAPSLATAIGFDQALLAAAGAPAVQAIEAALAARQQGDKHIARQPYNPELSAAAGPSLPGPGVSLLLGAAQSWSLADLGQVRRQAADRERSVLANAVRQQLLQANLEVAEAWIRTRSAQDQLQLAETEAQTAVELANAVTHAAARGAVLAADAAEAKWFAAEARLLVLSLEGQLRDAAGQLARTAKVAPEPPPRADGALPRPQVPADAGTWRQRSAGVAQLPEVETLRLQAIADRARAAEVAATHGSSAAFGGQLQVDPSGALAVLATVGLRWSAFDRGERAQAREVEAAARSEGESRAAAHRLEHELAVMWHDIEHTRETEALLASEVLPAVDALVQARQAALARGAGTVVDLIRVRRARIEVLRRLAQVRGERLWAEVRGWLLLGAMESK
ncbi:MAG: TolC family protein [Deltaproteobacteria bacterium]|nr:TolC family protein [Deltaproteobacteria bacterium]